jgi:hypothetical protein
MNKKPKYIIFINNIFLKKAFIILQPAVKAFNVVADDKGWLLASKV